MPDIQISLAHGPEREECYRLIYEVFCDEMGIMRGDADHQSRIIRDHGLEVSHVLAARMDGRWSHCKIRRSACRRRRGS